MSQVIVPESITNDFYYSLIEEFRSNIVRWSEGLNPNYVDPIKVVDKVLRGVHHDITSEELYELAAETAGALSSAHYEYSTLAGRIAVSNLHKNTPNSFLHVVRLLHQHTSLKTGDPASLIADDVYDIIETNPHLFENAIRYERDFTFDYFGFKTLERQYLLRIGDKVVERPQHLLMRVSIGIHKHDIAAALETYDAMSRRLFTHATPTLFNAGTPHPFLSSCFLVCTKSDSIEGIFETLKECALISKNAGGIGLALHDVRASGSVINGTGAEAKGVIPLLRVFNNTARYIDLSGRRRSGIAVYLEPWHSDVFDFLEMRKNFGREELRARDLFNALWIPDLFMKRVEADAEWSLFCPNEAPGLSDVWGDAFEELYVGYERGGRARRVVRAQDLWFRILEAQVETGTPFMLYKDAANRKSNHRNLGTIKCANLCTEIIEYASPDETAVCNLASIALPRFVRERGRCANGAAADGSDSRKLLGSLGACDRFFDFQGLVAIVAVITRNLNRVIDVGAYPSEAAEAGNKRHRPIGIGVQGLADTFLLLGMAFDSPEAAELNRQIHEAIYFAALQTSCELAQKEGVYETYEGCPVSKGVLQPDMWDVTPSGLGGLADWAKLRDDIARFGVRNSLLVAPMPTASTSQILGNNECFEPYTSNIYVRRVLGGEFNVVNPHLVHDLCRLGLWSLDLKEELVAAEGSVQHLPRVPESLRALYKTVWEIKQRILVDMAADRGAFIDQSQSLNAFLPSPTSGQLSSLHFHAWRRGLKTGMYYLRTRAAAAPIKFTVAMDTLLRAKERETAAHVAGSGGLGRDTQCNGATTPPQQRGLSSPADRAGGISVKRPLEQRESASGAGVEGEDREMEEEEKGARLEEEEELGTDELGLVPLRGRFLPDGEQGGRLEILGLGRGVEIGSPIKKMRS